jgi:hypothetical protein
VAPAAGGTAEFMSTDFLMAEKVKPRFEEPGLNEVFVMVRV